MSAMKVSRNPSDLFHSSKEFYTIRDNFETLHDVSQSIKSAGVNNCGLIFGIDYTISNRMQGQKTFGGRSLHDTSGPQLNPYQQVICILGETIEELNDDGKIPVYGFGDVNTKDKSIFPLKADGMCDGFSEVLDVYNSMTPKTQLSGPTNFAPLIEKAVQIVKETRKYHILVIVADGQVTDEKINADAIVEASNWPLSIVVIGVGDGPWDNMHNFDDGLPQRSFDNFQFVEFHETIAGAKNAYAALALRALMEIPEQFRFIKDHAILKKRDESLA
ncbi:hypothetical protein CHS0354_007539 [Potamilus streckersoni]|uniref:VWFA domain-containing protein n=1 Tax=Potamilus streckersoni TaxID=2493646 RepID=A0AAE0VFC8_9BIVA|nr:hypothetical protein CHS0354_007539 [Potamilus streckersoni]